MYLNVSVIGRWHDCYLRMKIDNNGSSIIVIFIISNFTEITDSSFLLKSSSIPTNLSYT